jgi:hypothetical protein
MSPDLQRRSAEVFNSRYLAQRALSMTEPSGESMRRGTAGVRVPAMPTLTAVGPPPVAPGVSGCVPDRAGAAVAAKDFGRAVADRLHESPPAHQTAATDSEGSV